MQVSWDVALNLNFTKGELNLLQVIFFFSSFGSSDQSCTFISWNFLLLCLFNFTEE